MVRASRAAPCLWRLVVTRVFKYLRRGWCVYLSGLACVTNFALDWLEEFHGNVLHAIEKLDIPEEDSL